MVPPRTDEAQLGLFFTEDAVEGDRHLDRPPSQVRFSTVRVRIPSIFVPTQVILPTGSMRAATSVALLLSSIQMLAQTQRITSAIDDAHRVRLPGSLHPKAQPRYERGPVAPDQKLGYITLLLQPSDSQQGALEGLLGQQQDPSSSHYHAWLTPEQFGSQFGFSATDISAIVRWLESHGFHIENVAHAKNWVAFSGSASQVQQAFHSEIHQYSAGGETHFANATELSLPAALDHLVSAVRGLNDFDLMPGPTVAPLYTTPSGTNQLAPDDWATIYDVMPLYKMGIDGSGQRLAIIGRSDITTGDMDAFRSTFGLSPSTIEQHLIGPDPGVTNAAGEARLDLEWAGAIARNATLVYVYANNFNDAAQAVVDQNLATVMSESFGTCEPQSAAGNRAIAQQANAEGITFVASSGDSGPAACDPHGIFGSTNGTPASGGFAISLPASFPEVTAVGGTQFNDGGGQYWSGANTSNGASAVSYIPEVVWNASGAEGLLASGGGASIDFAKPAWQTAPGVPDDGLRDIPDIAFSASGDHDPYIVVRSDGTRGASGGTSAAAPSFAGVLALLNQYVVSTGLQSQPGLGNVNPGLYRLARATTDVFHDITQGDAVVPCVQGSPDCTTGSYGYAAGPGYDLATGLGSLDVYHFVTEWGSQAGSITTTVTANPTSISFGDPVQVTATVTPVGQAVLPTGSVTFSAGATILGSAALVNSAGSMMATLTVPGGLLSAPDANILASYAGDSHFSGSTGSVTVRVASQTSGSNVVLSITPNPAHGGQAVRVTLSEKNGVPTTITGWTINGNDDSSFILQDFGSAAIPAYGTVFTGIITVNGATFPATRVYKFTGMDADGRTWSQQVTLTLMAPLGSPQMVLSGAPSDLQPNFSADPLCQWPQQILLEEHGGFAVQLTRLIAGGTDLTRKIQQLFGTSLLAPFGSLQTTICWPVTTGTGTVSYEIDGTDSTGSPVAATMNAVLSPPAASSTALSVSMNGILLAASPGGRATPASLNLTADGAAWSVSVFPANQNTAWLSVSPTSGTGSQPVTVSVAAAARLAVGVYNATLVFQAAGTNPQFIEVPVVLTVGGSSAMAIDGVSNGASFQPVFAPGMVLSVFGTQLAPSIQAAGSVPLPSGIMGVSATVNGVAAPLFYVSPTQLNIQVPYEVGAGPAVVGVSNNGQAASAIFTVSPSAPGIFTDAQGHLIPASTGKPGDTLSLFLTGDGTVSPALATGASPFSGTPLNFLPQSGLPVAVTVGGVAASIAFEGIPPGLVGTAQVNFVIPQNVSSGVQPVVVTVGGVPSQGANLLVAQ